MLSNSGPFTLIKFALDSLATALANKVFPHPGGPQSNTPHAATMPTALNKSGLLIGCTTAIWSSSLVFCNAPMSAQVTSGTVAKPSRLDEGCTCFNASIKSAGVIHKGASWVSVSGSGWAIRKCAIEPDVSWEDRPENRGGFDVEASGWGCNTETGTEDTSVVGGLSITIEMSCSSSTAAASGSGSGSTSVPSEICLNILFTAIIPAAPVRAERSAPTYPGVAFARALKLKSPSNRSFAQRTLRILR